MKKITFTLLTALGLSTASFGQANVSIQAPLYDGSNSSLSTQSGSVDAVYHRSCWLVLASELTGLSLTNSVISTFGLAYTQGNVSPGATGNFTIYFQPTSDVTYNKGTNWATILTGMTPRFQGPYTLPVTNGFTTVTLPLSPAFPYAGGGVYVALEWYGPTSANTQWARAQCNTTGLSTTGGVRGIAPAAGPAPTTLSTTAFRPSFVWTASNTATNEAGIVGFQPIGQVAKIANLSQTITVDVRNNSGSTMNNIPVGLLVSGANTFADSKTITTLASGSVTTVSFNTFTATNNGSNLISVSTPSDQLNSNNTASWTQSVTCSEVAITPALGAGNYTSSAWAVSGSASGGIMAFEYYTSSSTVAVVSVKCVVPSFSNANNGGNALSAVVCDATGQIIAQGNPVTLSATNMDVLATFPFTTPFALAANTDYFIGISASSNTHAPIGVLGANNSVFGHYRIPAGGGAPVQSDLDWLSIQASLVSGALDITASYTTASVCKSQPLVLTASGANTYTWSGGGNLAALTVTAPTTNTPSVKNYTVTGTNTVTGCRVAQAVKTISIGGCNWLGLASNGTIDTEILVFPNPSNTGIVNVQGLIGKNQVVVLNMVGQVVYNTSTEEELLVIDLKENAAGSYLIKVTNADGQNKMIKVVKE